MDKSTALHTDIHSEKDIEICMGIVSFNFKCLEEEFSRLIRFAAKYRQNGDRAEGLYSVKQDILVNNILSIADQLHGIGRILTKLKVESSFDPHLYGAPVRGEQIIEKLDPEDPLSGIPFLTQYDYAFLGELKKAQNAPSKENNDLPAPRRKRKSPKADVVRKASKARG